MPSSHPRPWDLAGVEPPWGDRPSLYRHIRAHIDPQKPGLLGGGRGLPDEELVVEALGGARWIAGGLDGVCTHHGGPADDADELARAVVGALRTLAAEATPTHAAALYALLTAHRAVDYADALYTAVVAAGRWPRRRLRAIARWLAAEAADREPVKVGMLLLGLLRDRRDLPLLQALGRHEEFTLFTVWALPGFFRAPERALYDLARQVEGWGRVHAVERLDGARDPEVKAWLLREGYRDGIIPPYTACLCARTGDLAGALRVQEPDEALLQGAGDLLARLIGERVGPVPGIYHYPDAAEAMELYLGHLQDREVSLEQFLDVGYMGRFLQEQADELQDPALGWAERRERCLALVEAIRARPDWEARICAEFASAEGFRSFVASQAALCLGIDPWEKYWECAQRGSFEWYALTQTDDPERMDRVIALAIERLPLQEIACGPENSANMAPDSLEDFSLQLLLQALQGFPGKGWPLIETALQGRAVSTRQSGVQTLAAWGRDAWPPEAEGALEAARAREPNEALRELIRQVLAGEYVWQG